MYPRATGRLAGCLRLLRRPCVSPPAPALALPPSMSLSCSSGHKVLESPFSHLQLYGVEHPTCSGSGRRKGKATKCKRSSGSLASSDERSASAAKPKSKKKKSGKGSSAPPTRNHAHKVTSPASFSLARVDSDPHSAPTRLKTTPRSAPSSNVAANSEVRGQGAAKKTTECRSRFVQGVSKSAKSDLPRANEKGTSTISSSLLSFPKMSTSELILSMCNGHRARDGGGANTGGGEANSGAAGNWRHGGGVALPPYMRVPRQAFVTSSHHRQGKGEARRNGAVPLDMQEIGRGLGRLQYKHIIIMSGAGISTPSGIPDFRTPGTGLYDNLQQYNIPDPTSIFDITYFTSHPKPFFTLARELYPGSYQPSPAHHFLRLLQEKKVLLRNYTQNIDGLERIAGVCPGKLVEAHGSFATASCIQCGTKHSPAEVKATIFDGKVPRCKHKRCYGLVKPDIVFFGEDLPQRFHTLQLSDFSKCDLLMVMGTSLEVEPFASLATLPGVHVPRLLLNRELVGPFKHRHKRLTDVTATGDLVESMLELVRAAGWEEELRALQDRHKEAATSQDVLATTPHAGTSSDPPLPTSSTSSPPGAAELTQAVSELSIREGGDVGVASTLDEVRTEMEGSDSAKDQIT